LTVDSSVLDAQKPNSVILRVAKNLNCSNSQQSTVNSQHYLTVQPELT